MLLQTRKEKSPFFLVKPTGNTYAVGPVEDYEEFFEGVDTNAVSLLLPFRSPAY